MRRESRRAAGVERECSPQRLIEIRFLAHAESADPRTHQHPQPRLQGTRHCGASREALTD